MVNAQSVSVTTLSLISPLTFQERSQRAEVESELRSKSVSEKAVSELEEMVRDIRTERDMLKRANDRLMKG